MHNMTPCINLQGGQEFGQMNKPSDLTAKRQLTQLELSMLPTGMVLRLMLRKIL